MVANRQNEVILDNFGFRIHVREASLTLEAISKKMWIRHGEATFVLLITIFFPTACVHENILGNFKAMYPVLSVDPIRIPFSVVDTFDCFAQKTNILRNVTEEMCDYV